MKILLSSIYHISSSNGGGNEQYLHQLASALTAQKHQVIYLTSQAKKSNKFPYKIIIKPISHFLGKPLISHHWIQLIKQLDFDIFHAAGSGLALHDTANFVKTKLNKPTVLTYQGDSNPKNFIFRLASNFEHYLIPKYFDQIITTTPYYETILKKQWPNKLIKFIPMMVSPHIKNLKITQTQARQKLNLKNKKTILFIGKLSSHQYYKGVDVLIDSAKYLPSDYQIVIIGSGDKKESWQNYVKQSNLEDKIIFTSFVPDDLISTYFKASDLFVLPSTSDSEGFGLVLIESMRCCLPTLTTTAIGSANYFKKFKVTNFVPPNNSKNLAYQIIKIINHPDQDQIQKAYNFSLNFTPKKMAEKTLELYKTVHQCHSRVSVQSSITCPVNAGSRIDKNNNISTLFLNENPLPPIFTQGTIAGKELRLRASINQIEKIHVISRSGKTIADDKNNNVGDLEKKVEIQLLPNWSYYFTTLPLFIFGFFHCLKNKPRLIEAESPILSGPAAVFLGFIFNIPTIVEYRASYEELIKQKLIFIPLSFKQKILDIVQFWTMKNASAVIANSKYYQKYLAKHKIKSVIINPGLQYVPINPLYKEGKMRSNRGVLKIGYLGRLEPEKGILVFLDTIKILAKDKSLFNFKIEIAGTGSFEKNLINQIKKFNLQKYVKYLGFAINYQTLSSWDILVNPNTVNHPLEMVNVEAAYCGVPVVCFGDEQIPETVIHGKTGLKVSSTTPQALAQVIKKLMLNEKFRQKLSSNSHSFAMGNYDFQIQSNKLKKLYKNLGIID